MTPRYRNENQLGELRGLRKDSSGEGLRKVRCLSQKWGELGQSVSAPISGKSGASAAKV
jgi:hypothetical protein